MSPWVVLTTFVLPFDTVSFRVCFLWGDVREKCREPCSARFLPASGKRALGEFPSQTVSNDQRCGYRCPFGVCHPSVPFSWGFEIKSLLAFTRGQRTRPLRRLPCGHCPRPSAQIAAGGLRDFFRIPFRKRCLGGSSTLSLPSANIRPHRVPRQKDFGASAAAGGAKPASHLSSFLGRQPKWR